METFEYNGVEYGFTIEPVDHHGAPWDEHDGHGVVSEWTTRDKAPGELVLAQDGRRRRFYDFAESCRIARRDGWDAAPLNTGAETKRQQAAKAARADFEYLRRWCAGDWQWVGVVLHVKCECCGEWTDTGLALWGIESHIEGYLDEVAHELAQEHAPSIAA